MLRPEEGGLGIVAVGGERGWDDLEEVKLLNIYLTLSLKMSVVIISFRVED